MNTAPLVNPADQSRGQFFQSAGVLSVAALAPRIAGVYSDDSPSPPPAFYALKSLGDRVRPITADEFRQRIEHVQRLMADAPPAPSGSPLQAGKYDPLFFAPGTSLYYFTGIPSRFSDPLMVPPIPPA